MRYHISSKTAENEAINTTMIIKVVAATFSFEHVTNIMWTLLSYFFQIPFWTRHCALEDNNGILIFQVYTLLKLIGVITTGVVYDVLLMKFLEKRNKQLGPGQAKLVKWKSSNEPEYTFTIPISAAAVSLASMVAMVGMVFSIAFSVVNGHNLLMIL